MHGADDLVFGLRCNFYSAVVVKTPIELDTQPYNYNLYAIEWKELKGGEDDDD